MGRYIEYQVIGRKLPTASDETPKLYRMRIFAPNEVRHCFTQPQKYLCSYTGLAMIIRLLQSRVSGTTFAN